jgi:hypothetical protein
LAPAARASAAALRFCPLATPFEVRLLTVREAEALGPCVARYLASKLWGGEEYFVQIDSHIW